MGTDTITEKKVNRDRGAGFLNMKLLPLFKQ
jgi:hypothetical protein